MGLDRYQEATNQESQRYEVPFYADEECQQLLGTYTIEGTAHEVDLLAETLGYQNDVHIDALNKRAQ